MKPYTILGCIATMTLAYPGMDRVVREIKARDYGIEKRSPEMIGDLIDGASSATGSTIKSILQGEYAIARRSTYTAPGPIDSDECKKDTCCIWSYIASDMQNAFQDGSSCSDLARGAIRQGFHDAATWDKGSSYGGADGSLLLSDELSRSENAGLESIGDQTKSWFQKYRDHNITMADLIQAAAIVGVVSCPGGPRIRLFVGRQDNSQAGPTGMLPSAFADAQSLIDLFAAKTFSADDLVALVGAHTVAKQSTVDASRSGASEDSTPGTWDNKIYSETLDSGNKSILTFPSDKNLATYSQTSSQWNTFACTNGQSLWANASILFGIFQALLTLL
ncbi:hypothetical protein PFICI_14854 [Pestalotiopsis fici W106-1]|uniref:Peroxidase n=1 Tax=Pestalotiopsis fici (strain W106-1 / CGMCC3.15140) TaxID=1229662 RepID=W3WHK3_PESFW|nr:uncharacterized protein PFICI_14854 [Pestalotiopsis fici W106-1]ETS73249.1 hypothetical protein PFICI_14854 [Pestalotiopsis fici W106-1]